jgi:peptidoglycan/LPS O-acetylase OafA/YrhL
VRNLSGPHDAADFMARRIWRIVPLLYIVTAACVLGLLIRGQFIEPGRVLNGLTVIPLFPTIARYQFALIPAWSLAFEMSFYLMVTAAVALRLNRIAMILIVLPFTLRFPLMAEFALGVFLYEVWTLFPTFAKASLEWSPSSPLGKALLWLGTISYSLYLTHVVTFDALAPLLWPLGRTGMALVMAPLAILVAALTYQCVEAPLQRMKPKRQLRGKAATGGVKSAV